jgi:hypothetical protein
MLDEVVSVRRGRKAGLIMKPNGMCLMRGALVAMGLALGLGLAPVLHADDENGNTQPGRAVRLSSVDGPVQVVQGGQVLADQAVANTPLFEGTELNTGDNGRAEVQFEDGSVARIPPQSSLALSVLRPDGDTEIQLSGGMGYFELQGASQGPPLRVRFGSAVVTASGFTVIRVKLDDGPPSVAVFSGNARLEDSAGTVDLHGGESIALNSPNPADSSIAESIEPDSWDAWNSDRDQALTASETPPSDANLPQSNNPAWGDLNANGTWYNVPGTGSIWSPYEASNSGWDPYGTGYWMWTPGYGYVWVSGEPWGYMPYQCGAWSYYDAFGWGWAPGACQAWWGGGYGGGGWVYTVAATPKWYKLPVRPGPPKGRDPHPVLRDPVLRAHPVGPTPLIPIRRTLPVQGTPLPPRDRTTPVNIGGTVAAPMRPEPVRTIFNHQPAPGNRTVTAPPPERPVYSHGQQTLPDRGNWPSARPTEPGRPAPPPQSAPRPEAPMQRPSFGGEDRGGGRSAPPPPSFSRPSPPPAAPSRPSPPPAAPSHPAPPPAAPSHSSPPPAPGHPK